MVIGDFEWCYEDDQDFQEAAAREEAAIAAAVEACVCEDDFEDGEFEDDGQPTTYEEYQDLHGGDDWDHGQYDSGEDW